MCKVIIDGGSSENMLSKEMVDKLKIKSEKDPRPYKISWFKKGNEVRLHSSCLISLTIGKSTKGSIGSDLVPTDACHILLGGPWQYDRKTIHKGERKRPIPNGGFR